jgi:hypothetical protein
MNSNIREMLTQLDQIDHRQRELANSAPPTQLGELIAHFDAIRNLHARLKEIAADVNQTADRLSASLVPEAMRAAGFTTVNHSVGRVSISSRVTATLVDKHGAMQWLRTHGLGDLIIETVNSNTLSAQAKAMLEVGDELPPEHFKISTKTYTSITKPGPKGQRKYHPVDESEDI